MAAKSLRSVAARLDDERLFVRHTAPAAGGGRPERPYLVGELRTVGLDHALVVAADWVVGSDGRLERMVVGEQSGRPGSGPARRESLASGPRATGGEEIAELTGDSCRSVNRQLGRARRRLSDSCYRPARAG